MRRRLLGTLIAIAGVASFTWATDSAACSPGGCDRPLVRPAGESLPSNAPALPLRFISVPDRLSASLVDDRTGAEVPGDLRPWAESPDVMLFVPHEPLVAGSYSLAGDLWCRAGGGDRAYWVPFELGAPAPVPTLAGSVSARPLGIVPDDFPGTTCFAPSGALAALEIVPGPGLAPWLAATSWRVEVDGQLWGTIRLGGLSAGGTANCGPYQRAQLLWASCQPDAGSRLAPGQHQGLLHALIAGVDGGPDPLPFEVDLSCDAGAAPAVVPALCEAWSVLGIPGLGTGPDSGHPAAPRPNPSGCSAASGTGFGEGLILLGVLCRRARRRGREFGPPQPGPHASR